MPARPQWNPVPAGSPDYSSDAYYEPYDPGNDQGQGSGRVARGRGGSGGPERFDRGFGPRGGGKQTFSFFDQGTGFGSPGHFGGDIRSFGCRSTGASSNEGPARGRANVQ